MKKFAVLIVLILPILALSQSLRWANGTSYYQIENGEINQYTLPDNAKTPFVTKTELTPAGQSRSLSVRNFSLSNDQTKVLIFTNTKKVWRLDTRGDYWVLDRTAKTLKQVGKDRPESSLLFAKLSPDATQVA